ncbi:MAG: hypothetical protein ACJATA_000777 [Sphingobacteriales bacterium]|jgi:hypothetical protein
MSTSITSLIAKDLRIEINHGLTHDDEILIELSVIVTYLLEKDPERLFQGLYRMDVDEIKIKKAFSQYSGERLVEKISILIIERQKLKIYWREKMKGV